MTATQPPITAEPFTTPPLPAASPAPDSGRSASGQALRRVSTSSSAARSSRIALIFAVSSGFSIGSPPPPPEQ